jgi:hypothetical protein
MTDDNASTYLQLEGIRNQAKLDPMTEPSTLTYKLDCFIVR